MRLSLIYIIGFFLLFCSTPVQAQSAKDLYKSAILMNKVGKPMRAVRLFDQALKFAEQNRDIKLQMKCHQQLAELTDNVVLYKKAIRHYKEFSRLYNEQEAQIQRKLRVSNKNLSGEVIKKKEEVKVKSTQINELKVDSSAKAEEILSLTKDKLLAEIKHQQKEMELSAHKLELSEEKNKRDILYGILGLIGLAAIFLIVGFMQKQKANKTLSEKNEMIASEKQKSEDLLLNILPVSVATELKETGQTSPHSFANATVMFTDFKGFTQFAEKLSPEEVVSELDFCFRAFDDIIAKRNIEKIKTIGDAYLCVSGLPTNNPNHAKDILEAAIEFQEFLLKTAKTHYDNGKDFFEMRIGIHSGPLVAGVVGSKKFAYDIWGDTVNIAARMEQAGQPGKINVSQTVYDALLTDYGFEHRGKIEAKNKAPMNMYFLKEIG